MPDSTKEVYFGYYCPHCTHCGEDEDSDVCNECLTYPYREDSHKPINFMDSKGNVKAVYSE